MTMALIWVAGVPSERKRREEEESASRRKDASKRGEREVSNEPYDSSLCILAISFPVSTSKILQTESEYETATSLESDPTGDSEVGTILSPSAARFSSVVSSPFDCPSGSNPKYPQLDTRGVPGVSVSQTLTFPSELAETSRVPMRVRAQTESE